MGAAFTHLAMGIWWLFGKRPLSSSNRAAKMRDSPYSTLILPGEPNNQHCSKEDHLL